MGTNGHHRDVRTEVGVEGTTGKRALHAPPTGPDLFRPLGPGFGTIFMS